MKWELTELAFWIIYLVVACAIMYRLGLRHGQAASHGGGGGRGDDPPAIPPLPPDGELISDAEIQAFLDGERARMELHRRTPPEQ